MSLKLGKTAAIHFLSQVAVSVSGFVATFVFARVLGAEGVGIYALGMSIVIWVLVPVSGLREALKKRVSEGVEPNAYFTSGIFLNLVVVLFSASLVIAFRPIVDDFVGVPIAEWIALVLVTTGLFDTLRDALHGESKVTQAGWIKLLESILQTAFQVSLILLGYQIVGLFAGHALALVTSMFVALYFSELQFTMPSKHHFSSIIQYARHSWSGGLKGNAFNWMDTIVLGLFVSASLVGIYKVAWTLATFLVVLSNSISSTLFPEISKISTEENTELVKHYLDEGLVFTGLFLIPGFFGSIVIGEELLRIYETEFARGSVILVILIAARTVDAYASQILTVIKAMDHPDVVLRIDLLFVVINIVLNLTLVYLYGWYGAAIATLLSGCISLLFSYVAISQLIGQPKLPIREIGEESVASLVMVVCVVVIKPSFSRSIWWTVCLVGFGALIYTATLLLLSPRIRQKTIALSPDSLLEKT